MNQIRDFGSDTNY